MNKTIWMLWLQGWDKAPHVATRCRNSFAAMNPGWQIRCLDADSYPVALGADGTWITRLAEVIPPAALSDLIRIQLLRTYGGVWADATVLCLRPLDEWLPLVATETLFAFRDPGPDRRLSSWFLAAPPADPIVAAWADACRHYWHSRDAPDEYHWFHYELAATLAQSDHLEALWSAAPYFGASAPHYLLPHHRKLNAVPAPDDLTMFSGSVTPVLKLTHKIDGDSTPPTNYATVTGGDPRLAMHYPPNKTCREPRHDRRLSLLSAPEPGALESLRLDAIVNNLTIFGYSVEVITSVSGGRNHAAVLIDIRDNATATNLIEHHGPVIAFNQVWDRAREAIDQPLFTFDLTDSCLPYLDPAMVAPLPSVHWSDPTDTVALLGYDEDPGALATARRLCHEAGLPTENLPRAQVARRGDLSGHAFGVAENAGDAIFAERQALPCMTLRDFVELDVVRRPELGRLTPEQRQSRRHDFIRRSELTIDSLRSVVARLVSGQVD